MKILTAQQLAAADKVTLKAQNITSLELMERAASRAYDGLQTIIPKSRKAFKVFCGIGNNGGDGLVLARKLHQDGHHVKVFVVAYSPKRSNEFKENLNRLKNLPFEAINILKEGEELPQINNNDVVIDAIFGIGLNRPMPNWVNRLVEQLNHSKAYKVAVDMPSGLFSDRVPTSNQAVFKADSTLTFQAPKPVFYFPQTAEYAGTVHVIDIGLDQAFLEQCNPVMQVIEQKAIQQLRQSRSKFSHKGTYGHCLLIGGSYGMIGSMVLATRAALRSGAGKVTAMLPQCGYDIMQTAVSEAMVITTDSTKILEMYKSPHFQPEVVCFGMGAGTAGDTATFFKHLLKATKVPMLIDADGLNLLTKHHSYWRYIPENSVLTPHPGELQRLIGPWKDDFEKLTKVRDFVKSQELIMVVKGAHSLIVTPQKTYVNSTGNPGMATAGSGDVLSGLIAGLMAQGYSPEKAALFGAYIHGRAGDMALKNSSVEALIAGDLIRNFGGVFQALD